MRSRSNPEVSSVARRSAERRGRAGEVLAAVYLLLKGYRIVTRRFRCRAGEIDLVAKKRNWLIFVEVKSRVSGTDIETALAGVNRARIASAAQIFLTRAEHSGRDVRIDVIFLAPGKWPHHIKNAFGEAGRA